LDRKVVEFVQTRAFNPADFVLASNGNCRLNPGLARNVVRAVAATKNDAVIQLKLGH
jgi:hypothetical protein